MAHPRFEIAFQEATGVPAEVQRRRLLELRSHHAVPPTDAYRYGLLMDDAAGDWAAYIYRSQRGWNRAVSTALLVPANKVRRRIHALADKVGTAATLAATGLPVAPHVLIRRRSSADQVQDALRSAQARFGPHLFVKPRHGSGGQNSYLVTAGPRHFDTRLYDWHLTPTPASVTDIVRAASGGDMMVQPLLTTRGDDGLLPDTVNLRIVTVDSGPGPRPFSTTAGVPFIVDESVRFTALRVAGGRITGDDVAIKPWWPDRRSEQRKSVARSWAGHELAGLHIIIEQAVAAHNAFRGLFAIAWDVALTSGGPVFLEGNVGFAPETPQLDSGGLLGEFECPRQDWR